MPAHKRSHDVSARNFWWREGVSQAIWRWCWMCAFHTFSVKYSLRDLHYGSCEFMFSPNRSSFKIHCNAGFAARWPPEVTRFPRKYTYSHIYEYMFSRIYVYSHIYEYSYMIQSSMGGFHLPLASLLQVPALPLAFWRAVYTSSVLFLTSSRLLSLLISISFCLCRTVSTKRASKIQSWMSLQ